MKGLGFRRSVGIQEGEDAPLMYEADTPTELRHRHGGHGAQQRYSGFRSSHLESVDKHLSGSLAVIMACAAWVAASSGAILVNKHIMVDLKFGYPGAVAAFGMLGTSIGCCLVCCVFKLPPLTAVMTPRFYMAYIVPAGFFMALTFQAGNLAYLYLSVAFVQMLKALTPVSTMLWGFVFRVEVATLPLVASVSLITTGVMAASLGELNFNAFGVFSMVSSVTAEGLRLVLMQYILTQKQMRPLEALFYIAPAALFWLSLAVLIFEGGKMWQVGAWSIVASNPAYFAFSACVGFALNGLAMAVIKLASALALKVLGICKDVGLVGLGVVVFGEKVSSMQVMGYCISLAGFAWYQRIKALGHRTN